MRKISLLAATASVFALGSAPAMADIGDASDSATLVLNGFVETECEIGWNGGTSTSETLNFDVPAGAGDDHVEVGQLQASCNAPYSITMESERGRLENTDFENPDEESLFFVYAVEFRDDNSMVEDINAADAHTEEQLIKRVPTAQFLAANEADLLLDVDLNFGGSRDNGATDNGFGAERQMVAGHYTDTLTFRVAVDQEL
ncbi:MAG: hypothetical protein ACOC0V_00135 [Oceanicaulis sp.]